MIARMAAVLAVLTGPVWAEDRVNDWSKDRGKDWVALNGAELQAALNGTTLQYDIARQVFYPSGKTLYDNGMPSWGNWAVRADAYCSQWPPQDGWTCFALERHSGDGRLRFVSQTGAMTEGSIVE